MSRKAKFSAVVASLLLAAALAGCGSSHREANANPATVARVDEATCRVCHSTTIDPVSQTALLPEFLSSVHNPDPTNPNAGVNPNPVLNPTGCQGCHGGGAEHNGVGPIPFPDPLAANRCVTCHTNVPAAAVARSFTTVCAPCHSDTTKGVQGVHAARSIDSLPNPDNCVNCHAIQAPQHGNLVGDNNGVRAVVQEFSKWSHHVTGVAVQNAHCATCHLEGEIGADGTIVRSDTFHMVDAKVHLRNADSNADMQWDPANPNHSTMDTFCMSCHDADGASSPQTAAIRALMTPAPGKIPSARNPFGDTISNRYDKMQRPAVTNVSDQFGVGVAAVTANTGNNSHHGVKGPRYSGRTRVAGPRQISNLATFAQNSSQTLQGRRSTIFDAGNFNALYTPLGNTGGEAAPRTGAVSLGDDSTLHCGDCHTVGQWKVGSSFDRFGVATTVAIGAHGSNNEYLLRNTLGTDQRHTQNAFLVGNGVNVIMPAGATTGIPANDPAVGAVIPNAVVVYTNPNAPFLVCYNCHAYNKYGSLYLGTGLNGANAAGQPHAGEYDQVGRCNGIGNTLPFNGYTTGVRTDGTEFLSRIGFAPSPPSSTGTSTSLVTFASQPAFAPGFPLVGSPPLGEQNSDFGDIYGIQCLNCHNSGLGNAYGGIHGSANNTSWNNGTTTITPASLGTPASGGYYIDGMGNANKNVRFLPGLGNVMHVPGTLGGFTGGSVAATIAGGPAYTYVTGAISNDTNWEQKQWLQTPNTVINAATGVVSNTASAGAGCYTLGPANVPPAAGAAIVTSDVSSGLNGPPVLGEGAFPTGIGNPFPIAGTWGGCDDHQAGQAKGNHGFLKAIVRPVTY